MARVDPRARLPRLTLIGALYSFVLLTLVLVGATGYTLSRSSAQSFIDVSLDRAVRVRTMAAGQMLMRTIYQDWQDLQFLAERLDDPSDEAAEGLMAGIRGDGSRISWIGVARVDGEVIAATDGMLVGADVGSRPWFRNSLRGPFAGDVHDAVLLAELLGSDDEEPLRFIDLAVPVTDADGEVTGVVGMHINSDWVTGILRDSAASLGIDLFLVNPSGDFVFSSIEEPVDTDLEILRAARVGTTQAQREVWPDGQEYFTSLVPRVGYEDLPEFGWRMIGRIGPESFRGTITGVVTSGLWGLAAMVAALILLTAVFAMTVLRPLNLLSLTADRLADGETEYPMETRSTADAARLSSALARLQERRARGKERG